MLCKKCGATIPGGAPGTIAVCEYCGHKEHIPVPAPPRVARPAIHARQVSAQVQASVKRGIIVAVVGFMLAMGIGIFVCVAVATKAKSTSDRVQEANRQIDRATNSAERARAQAMRQLGKALGNAGVQVGDTKKVWKLSEITSAPKGMWFPVDTTGMTGTLNEFDAIANYQWVHGLAKGWSADAKLVRLSVKRLRHDGTAPNASPSGKGGADYRFYSPSRFAAAEKLSEVSEDKVYDGFRVWIREGKVSAMIGEGSPEARKYPHAKVTCTYAQLIKGAQPIRKQPYYDLYLRYRKHRRSWTWSVDRAFSLRTRRRRRSRVPASATLSTKTCKRR